MPNFMAAPPVPQPLGNFSSDPRSLVPVATSGVPKFMNTTRWDQSTDGYVSSFVNDWTDPQYADFYRVQSEVEMVPNQWNEIFRIDKAGYFATIALMRMQAASVGAFCRVRFHVDGQPPAEITLRNRKVDPSTGVEGPMDFDPLLCLFPAGLLAENGDPFWSTDGQRKLPQAIPARDANGASHPDWSAVFPGEAVLPPALEIRRHGLGLAWRNSIRVEIFHTDTTVSGTQKPFAFARQWAPWSK